MLSYTERRNLFGNITQDSSSDNLSFGDTLMNENERMVINSQAWDFTQRTSTDTTVASQQFYNLPVNYRKLIGNPTITSGSITYIPREAPNRAFWDRLNSVSTTSDIPQYFFIFDRQIGFYPTPATNGNTITLPYELQQKDLNIADYTTGTITTATNGSTAITGSGTSWTAGQAGLYFRITRGAAANLGDGEWYEITSIDTGTTLTLAIEYEGTSVAAGSAAYTIAQRSLLPDGYDRLPIYHAAVDYWSSRGDGSKADRYQDMYDRLLTDLRSDHGTKTSNLVVSDAEGEIRNPNLFIQT